MKTYRKPQIIALSLDTNETICKNCQIDAIGAHMNDLMLPIYEAAEINPKDSATIAKLFAIDEAQCAVQIDAWGYCKFGPSGSLLFNSI